VIINWFRGIKDKIELTALKYNGDWTNLINWWNDHNNGVRKWDNVNTTNLTATNATITNLTVTNATVSNVNGTFIGLGRNRIINGDMQVDQRNEGGLVTVNLPVDTYGVDRFFGIGTAASGVFKTQQVSTTPPTGFNQYIHVTVTTAEASPAAGHPYSLGTTLEGYNVRDFLLGSASAKTFTLSFWVRSNLTGQFSGAFSNGAGNRSYPYIYTVNSASTWEQKTVTLTGDLTGTWLTTNGAGLVIYFDLGSGSTFQGTSGTWASVLYISSTGSNKIISSLSNTLDITGVQLEIGSTATSFEYLPVQMIIALCNRYYWKTFEQGIAPVQNVGSFTGAICYVTQVAGVVGGGMQVDYPTAMRVAPTIVSYNPSAANTKWRNQSASTDSGAFTTFNASTKSIFAENPQVVGDAANALLSIHITADCDF